MTGETHQRWLNSEELDFAWFYFASEYEKEQYRNAKTEHRMEALSIMMKAELISKIHSEYLYCYGLRIAPNLSEGPERIPSFLFAELSNKGPLLENIDWGKSSLRSTGREYVQVRVSAPQNIEPTNKRPEPSKIGRPRVDEPLCAVVRELVKSGQLSGKSRKEQEDVVREKARNDYPNLFPTQTRPSRGKILGALKAEGFIPGRPKV